MLIVRDVFTAKPGMASKLAKLLRDALSEEGFRVMTDVVGDFNTVVMESEAKDLTDFQKRFEAHMNDPKFRQRMSGYTEMYTVGKREIYRQVD